MRGSSSCPTCGNKPEDVRHNEALGQMALYFDNDADSDREGTPAPVQADGGEITEVLNNYGSPVELSPHSVLTRRQTSASRTPPTKTVVVEKVVKVEQPCRKERCLQRRLENLQKVDPKFTNYLEKRFYLVGRMRQRNHELHAQLEGLLRATAALKLHGRSIRKQGSSEDVAAGLEDMIANRRMARVLKHKRLCKCLLAHYMHDVDRLLQHLHAKNRHYATSIEDWLRMNKGQKERLYKILLHAQQRDMQRLLQLRELKLWYNRKLHVLDAVSRKRLQRMMALLQQQEYAFQTRLWARLQELQQSSNEWAQHERAYKEALLMMGRQHSILLRESYRQGRELDYLTRLVRTKVLPQQEALALASMRTVRKLDVVRQQCTRSCRCKKQAYHHVHVGAKHGQGSRSVHQQVPIVIRQRSVHAPSRARTRTPRLSRQLGKCKMVSRLKRLKRELLKTLDEGCCESHPHYGEAMVKLQSLAVHKPGLHHHMQRLPPSISPCEAARLQKIIMQPLIETDTAGDTAQAKLPVAQSTAEAHRQAQASKKQRTIRRRIIRKKIIQRSIRRTMLQGETIQHPTRPTAQ